MPALPLIFDGHNDLLLKLYLGQTDAEQVRDGGGPTQIDLPRARAGGFAGGMFAIFTPEPAIEEPDWSAMAGASYDLPLPDILDADFALRAALAQASHLLALEETGSVRICRTADDIEAALEAPEMAAVLHLEGADCIDGDFHALHVLHAMGLRSLGPVWSRKTRWGEGVPFRYPSTGDTGPGLTEDGKRLVRECNRIRIALDISHLNEKGVDDLAAISDAPLIATHCNVHAISPHARNLTDRQLAMIAERGGMVGVNFATAFLRPDGQMNPDVALEQMVRHVDYLVDKLGEGGVGFGSDFDGAMVPAAIGDVAGLVNLRAALFAAGYGEPLMQRICHGNWIDILRRSWA